MYEQQFDGEFREIDVPCQAKVALSITCPGIFGSMKVGSCHFFEGRNGGLSSDSQPLSRLLYARGVLACALGCAEVAEEAIPPSELPGEIFPCLTSPSDLYDVEMVSIWSCCHQLLSPAAHHTSLFLGWGWGRNSIAFGKSTSQRIYPEQHTPKIG